MKLEIGYGTEVYGTVEISDKGLIYAGPKSEAIKTLVESMRRPDMTDQALIESLPNRLSGHVWAKEQ